MSLFPSHNHSIKEVGQLLADERMGTRGAGFLAEGLSGLPALSGRQGPVAAQTPVGSWVPLESQWREVRGSSLLSVSPSSHEDMKIYCLPTLRQAQLLTVRWGRKRLFPTLGMLRSDKEVDCEQPLCHGEW